MPLRLHVCTSPVDRKVFQELLKVRGRLKSWLHCLTKFPLFEKLEDEECNRKAEFTPACDYRTIMIRKMLKHEIFTAFCTTFDQVSPCSYSLRSK